MKQIIMNVKIGFLLLLLSTLSLSSQSHWESIVQSNDTWKYLAATSEPQSTWYQPNFDDNLWKSGIGGIGYADGDDGTIISSVNSVYLRKKFTVSNLAVIEKLLLDIDYDDAYVMYLNGKEVARSSNITAYPALYNSVLSVDHEVLLYQGIDPERYVLNKYDLIQGENTIAVHVLNNGISSSDLSSNVFINALINSTSILYNNVPAWFNEPFNFTSSNFPIVVINTDINPASGKPYEIPDDPKVLGNMKIIYHPDGSRNSLTDLDISTYQNYNGRIGIELRGSFSQNLPKKPYGLTTLKADNITNNNVSILGMPKENDWVLNSLAYDPSLIRNYLSYDLARNMGNYSPREMYCELMVNGDYKGLYIFMEKLKIDENRINIQKMEKTDIDGSSVTGGYVTKSDKTTGNDPIAWTMTAYNGWTINFIHDNPKPEDITSQQNNYIYNQFMQLQKTATEQNSSVINGFPTIIDIPTFIDFMIMSELSSNPDSYHYSTYFHKDRMGKLRAGPIWDFDLIYGNDLFQLGLNRSLFNVWQFDDNENTGPKFWKDLFSNPIFNCYLSKRWMNLTSPNQVLNLQVIYNKIDVLKTQISEAAVHEQARWQTISNHTANIDSIKIWLKSRYDWLNARLNNTQNCTNVIPQKLVISKIHYHPLDAGSISGDSLEFIEITNNSNSTIDLTGIYFSELGISYQFPKNSTITSNAKIFLASNSKAFGQFYKITPFGQFYRNLSNKSQKLVLSDAFGNIIDFVEYSDATPWYPQADGGGAYLEIIDLNADNSLSSNWQISDKILSLNDIELNNFIEIYPNPVEKVLNIRNFDTTITSFEITDFLGRVLISSNKNGILTNNIDVESLSPNIYLIKLYMDNHVKVIGKFVKK